MKGLLVHQFVIFHFCRDKVQIPPDTIVWIMIFFATLENVEEG